jgi:hypothetical protein
MSDADLVRLLILDMHRLKREYAALKRQQRATRQATP